MTRYLFCSLVSTYWALLVLVPVTGLADEPNQPDAFAVNQRLGRGVNLGNALEAPVLGAWGMEVRPEYIQRIAEAGFDSVRVPIRWSAHAEQSPPYAIDPQFLKLVDGIVDQSLEAGLAVVINFHHYEELYADPDGELTRFLELWRQVATRYRDRSSQLVFEILNEPHGELSHERWQAMLPKLLAVVRESNPKRAILIGPGDWNNVDALSKLRLPADDPMLIGTFHYYSPFRFTHQQASWVEGADQWREIPWRGEAAELEAIAADFDKAQRWAKEQNRPVYLGEFGAYSAADLESRARWTAAIAREARRRGFSFAYWEFGAGFGVYDRESGQWRQPLKQALLSPDP